MTPLLVPESSSRSSPGPPSSTASFEPPDPSRLAPEHAWYTRASPPRRHWDRSVDSLASGSAAGEELRSGGGVRRRRPDAARTRSGSRRRKGVWKKLLWVKQSYPDNYTDAPTFLSTLQRNPRWQPYDFWPLVADSTVIVQHVCSVAIFVCCFVGIYHEQLSPISVVSWGSAGTVLGWACWDMWIGQEEAQARSLHGSYHAPGGMSASGPAVVGASAAPSVVGTAGAASEDNAGDDAVSVGSTPGSHGLGLSLGSTPHLTRAHSRNLSATSLASPLASPIAGMHPTAAASTWSLASHSYGQPLPPLYDDAAGGGTALLSARNQQRLSTAKSAILIYAALLGLSPILKSLTQSTTSDSIWAMSTWLMFINVFFFDYGGEPSAKFPASLSTNAALMASTVLASRLTTIAHVFSLTLFSIEVFGLFPVFRRHLRHRSWHLHVALTVLLIVCAGAGLGVTLVSGNRVKAAILGTVVWSLATVLAMGGCSWWLIGLQRYKMVVIGPWDQARPIIRAGGWELNT